MIELAYIAATPHLNDISAHGTIDMALTHLALADPTYAAYFARRSLAGVTVILDNSAYELEHITGEGMHAEAVMAAAARTGAQTVICHDVLYNGPATVATTTAFLTQARATTDHGIRFMAVPQGRSRAEWLDCYRQLIELPGVDWIGLSKLSVPASFDAPVAEARLAAVEALLVEGDTPLLLHLLGGDRSLPWELREHRRRGHCPAVRSNDSSFAYWYAVCSIPVNAHTGRAARPAPDKPDLATPTDPASLATAVNHAALLARAAGLDSREEHPCRP